ncbi:MAG: hypothetical protein ACYTHJ_01465 [Planctomycetota bacterium]|jgi:YHS domain-containing protein
MLRITSKFLLSLAVLAGSLSAQSTALGDEGAEDAPKCPVMKDEAINLALKTDTPDGPVYFCCPGCVKKFSKKPDKYADGVKAQRAAMAKMPKVQVACPVTGEAVDQEVSLKHGDEKVYFCCGGCKDKFAKDPAKYAGKLAGSYTYQTICPVMEEPVKASVYHDLPTGERIYLCCKGCARKLVKNPQKYNKSLAAQHVHIDWDKVKEKMGG